MGACESVYVLTSVAVPVCVRMSVTHVNVCVCVCEDVYRCESTYESVLGFMNGEDGYRLVSTQAATGYHKES